MTRTKACVSWLPFAVFAACQPVEPTTPKPVVVQSGATAPVMESESSVPEPEPPRAMELAVYEVDDETDSFAPSNVPRLEDGIVLAREHVRGAESLYVEVLVGRGETIDAAKKRLEDFTRRVRIPPGTRIALQRFRSEDTLMPIAGWRTYLLKDERLLTDASLRSAELRRDEQIPEGYSLHLAFDEAGARILADVTERCLHRRIAFVIDGEVAIAPLVMERIEGGRAQVWLADVPESEIPDRFASGVRIERR